MRRGLWGSGGFLFLTLPAQTGQYTALVLATQAAAAALNLSLYVAIPAFVLDAPEPVQLPGSVDKQQPGRVTSLAFIFILFYFFFSFYRLVAQVTKKLHAAGLPSTAPMLRLCAGRHIPAF